MIEAKDKIKEKALFFHGFLGCPEDMTPLFLEEYDCVSYDLKKILFKADPLKFLLEDLEDYEFIVGYSFGGRILEDLKGRAPEKAKKWIFVSSRHTVYPDGEMKKRNEFRGKLYENLKDLPSFFEYWKGLSLFGGHQMDEYRSKHKLAYTPWCIKDIEQYLDLFFTSAQYHPKKSNEAHYFYGNKDLKYSKEGERLRDTFNVCSIEGGHRFLFEDPSLFKESLRRVLR